MSAKRQSPGEQVVRAIASLQAIGATPTRKTIATEAGLPLSSVDWHLRAQRDLGRIHSPANSVWNVVAQDHEDRAVSGTFLPNGRFKLEIGDTCLEMSLREVRHVALSTSGVALVFGK